MSSKNSKIIIVPFWAAKGPYILLYIFLLLVTLPIYHTMVSNPAQKSAVKQDVAGARTEVIKQVQVVERASIPTPTIYLGE